MAGTFDSCPLKRGVCLIGVSVKRGSTVLMIRSINKLQYTKQCFIHLGSDLSEQQLKLEEINLRTSINQDKQCWVNNKRTLIEITVQSSQQHIAIDLCIIFAYHIASKETSTETTFFATMALLFWKVSALPLNQPGSEEKHKIERPMIVQSKHKRKVRSAADVQSHFSQGMIWGLSYFCCVNRSSSRWVNSSNRFLYLLSQNCCIASGNVKCVATCSKRAVARQVARQVASSTSCKCFLNRQYTNFLYFNL